MDLHPVAMDLEAHTDGMFAAADAETGMLSLWSIEFVSQGDGDEVQTTRRCSWLLGVALAGSLKPLAHQQL